MGPIPAIPHFVKAMGHRVVSYLLNVSEAEGRQILNHKAVLTPRQQETLSSYIDLCRQLRSSSLEQGDSEQSFFHRLAYVTQHGHHVFNVWRSQHGGRPAAPVATNDPLVSVLCSIAAELYPLFLIKATNKPHLFHRSPGYLTAAIEKFPASKTLRRHVLADRSLERLFQTIGNEPHDTFGEYVDSTGHRGVITLGNLPASLLMNSYDLMRIRGTISADVFVSTVKEMLEIARSVADGEVAHIPMFVGFRNAALVDIQHMETKWGSVRRYSPGIAEYALQVSSLMAKRKDSGFMLESGYAFAINFGELLDDDDWPQEVLDAEQDRKTTELNISLCLALCYLDTKGPFVAPEWFWRIDPFSFDNHRIDVDTVQEAEQPVAIERVHLDDIERWSMLLDDTDSSGIRMAMGRLFSAARQPKSCDGLVDAIIALKNLFAASHDTHSIPDAVRNLVAADGEEMSQLTSSLLEDWNVLLSGDVWWDQDEIKEKVESCIELCLVCLHHLYLKHPAIVSDPARLKYLAENTLH